MAEHIKIPEQTPRIVYNVTVPTVSFVIPFAFFAPSDIVVHWGPTLMIQGVHYSVVTTGGFDKGFPGGLVNFITSLTSSFVVIERRVPIARTVDFPNSGPLQTPALNTELDKSVAIDQQLAGDIGLLDARIDVLELGDPRLGRALLFPPEDLALNHSLPAIGNRHDQVLGFRFDGEIDMQRAIVYPSPEPGTNAVLPLAAGRANRVLGWDVTGTDLDLVEVVAGAVVPNAGNIEYTAPFTGAVARSVADKLAERISIKDFGTHVGEGIQANDDAALAAAITFFNANPAGQYDTLFYPDGTYIHGPCPVRITRSQFAIRGESDGGVVIALTATGDATFLGIGDRTKPIITHVTVQSLAFDCSGVTGIGVLFQLENTDGVTFRQLFLRSFDTILDVGIAGLGVPGHCSSTALQHVTGDCRGKGYSAIVLRNGTVFECHNLGLRSSATPAIGNFAMLLSGTVFTVAMSTCNFENFDIGVGFSISNGQLVREVSIINCRFGNCARYGLFLQSTTGGFLQSVHVSNCWIECNTEAGIALLDGAGLNDNHIFSGNDFVKAGTFNFYCVVNSTNIVLDGNTFVTCNLFGNAIAHIEVPSGSGLVVTNNSNNLVLPSNRAQYGIHIGPNCDKYLVTGNQLMGTIAGYSIEADTLQSHNRLVIANNNSSRQLQGYSGLGYGTLDVNANYINTTPFVQVVGLAGGTVISTGLNGANNLGLLTAGITLQPGDYLHVDFTEAPMVVLFFQP